MLREWIEKILNVDFATPLTTQIWECTPLVVLNEAGGIEFAQSCTVDYSPTGKNNPFGYARVVRDETDGSLPMLEVNRIFRKERLITRFNWIAFPVPARLVLYGSDIGQEFLWFINGPALQVLDRQFIGPKFWGGRFIG